MSMMAMLSYVELERRKTNFFVAGVAARCLRLLSNKETPTMMTTTVVAAVKRWCVGMHQLFWACFILVSVSLNETSSPAGYFVGHSRVVEEDHPPPPIMPNTPNDNDDEGDEGDDVDSLETTNFVDAAALAPTTSTDVDDGTTM